jgi:hypothetical protein
MVIKKGISETSVFLIYDKGTVFQNVGIVNWWQWQRGYLKRRYCELMAVAAGFSETSVLRTDDSGSGILWNVSNVLAASTALRPENSDVFKHAVRTWNFKWDEIGFDNPLLLVSVCVCVWLSFWVCVRVAPTVAKQVCVTDTLTLLMLQKH